MKPTPAQQRQVIKSLAEGGPGSTRWGDRNPSAPASIAKSFAVAGKQQAAHLKLYRDKVSHLPAGTKIKGWEKILAGGDTFWQKGRRTVFDLVVEVGGSILDAELDRVGKAK